jgi:hypothetical protein
MLMSRVVVVHRGVLGEDGDPALTLEVGVVHHPLRHLLIGAECAALAQQRVDQRRLAVVDVGDDRHVAAEGVGDKGSLPEREHLPSIPGRCERALSRAVRGLACARRARLASLAVRGAPCGARARGSLTLARARPASRAVLAT